MIYTYDECVEKYGTKYLLEKAVSSGAIYRQEKGVYSDEEYVPEEVIVAVKYPKAVFTLNSAFYQYGLTDVVPDKNYIATDRNAAKIPDKRVSQVFERSDLLDLGVENIDFHGYKLRIYSKERLLIELLRHKNRMPFDYYKEIILNYRDMINELNIPLIQEYILEMPKSGIIIEAMRLEVL